MPRAVRYSKYGGVDVLQVMEVDRPVPAPGQFLLKVKATGINPGEAFIREGGLHAAFPAVFPSGQGYDLAGVIEEVGRGRGARGPSETKLSRSRSPAARRPSTSSWSPTTRSGARRTSRGKSPGSIYTAGATAYAGVRAAALTAADTVVVSGAAGGVGSIVSQLAKRTGATVIGLASPPNHEWLSGHGVIPVTYGAGVANRIREAAPKPVTKFIDTFGNSYVELALGELGLPKDHVVILVDPYAGRKYGVKADGWSSAKGTDVLGELLSLLANGFLIFPIAKTYPIHSVQDAYREVEKRHTRGKIALIP